MERARKVARMNEGPAEGSDLKRDEHDEPLVLSLQAEQKPAQLGDSAPGSRATARPPTASRFKPPAGAASKSAAAGFFGEDEDNGPSEHVPVKQSNMDAIMQKGREAQLKDLEAKAKRARLDHWLHVGIVVKVMSKELKEHGYYKQKAVIENVIDKYIGEVVMNDSGDVIRVDQAQLETVLPSPGGTVRLIDGPYKGKEVWQDYEDISKMT
eukprot:gene15458-21543_t